MQGLSVFSSSLSQKKEAEKKKMARTKGKGKRRPHALPPKKTQEFKQLQVRHLELHPSSLPLLLGSDLKTETPCHDIVNAAAGDTVGNRAEASVGVQPMSYLPLSPTTSLLHSIAPHGTPLSSSRTIHISNTKRSTSRYYLNKEKLAALSNHFNPISFVREKPSTFANHRLLLVRLNLWNFIHLDFGQNIHSNLIKQLIVHYNPRKPTSHRSHVNGCAILVTRAALARALSLPSRRLKLGGSDTAKTGHTVVSDEEAAFLDELVSSWLVLLDDGCELPREVLKVKILIREKKLEAVDWAGLIWFMVRSELLKREELVNCHYASHMQLLLKNQKPQLFVDHIELAGFLSTEAALCNEAILDYSLSASGEAKIVKGWEKQRILHVGDNAVGVEENSSEWKADSTQDICGKWRNSSPVQCEEESISCQRNCTNDLVVVNVDGCKGNELQEPQNTTQSPGDIDAELNITTRLIQDHSIVGEVSGKKFSSTYQQSSQQKEDGNGKLKLPSVGVKDDEIKWTAIDLFVGNSGEFPDSQGKKLTVGFKCNEKQQCQSELADLEFGSSSDMLMNEHCSDKRPNMECSGDFTANVMHVLSKLESQFEQMELDPDHDSGKKEFALDDLGKHCRTISDKLCTLNEPHVLKMESSNKELKLLPDEDKRNLSSNMVNAVLHATKVKDIINTEVVLLHHEDARELSEGLGKEEIFDRTGDLIDSQEKEEVNNDTECNQMDYNQQQWACLQERDDADLESVSANNMLVKNEGSNEERLKVDCSSNSSVNGMLSLGRLETNFHQMDLIFSEDSCGAKYRLNILMENQNTIVGETFTSDNQHAIETGDRSREVLQKELLEEPEENEQFEGEIGELLECQEKKATCEIMCVQVGSSTEHDTQMGDGDNEKEFSKGSVKEELFDARVGDSHDSQEVEICFISEKSSMDSKNQHTKIAMENDEKPEQLYTAKPETSGFDEILGTEMDLQNKNRFKASSFVEPFVVQDEIRFTNFDCSPLDKSLKREIDCLNDRQVECQLNVTNYSAAEDESFDMDCCTKQVELWMSRLKNAAKMDDSKNSMLLKELETKNLMLQQSEKRRRQEQHRYENHIHRLEREVNLMTNILDEYRTALNEVNKSFAEYRKRANLPDEEEEPIYVDHPDGGGKVVLARELISSKLKQG